MGGFYGREPGWFLAQLLNRGIGALYADARPELIGP